MPRWEIFTETKRTHNIIWTGDYISSEESRISTVAHFSQLLILGIAFLCSKLFVFKKAEKNCWPTASSVFHSRLSEHFVWNILNSFSYWTIKNLLIGWLNVSCRGISFCINHAFLYKVVGAWCCKYLCSPTGKNRSAPLILPGCRFSR